MRGRPSINYSCVCERATDRSFNHQRLALSRCLMWESRVKKFGPKTAKGWSQEMLLTSQLLSLRNHRLCWYLPLRHAHACSGRGGTPLLTFLFRLLGKGGPPVHVMCSCFAQRSNLTDQAFFTASIFLGSGAWYDLSHLRRF